MARLQTVLLISLACIVSTNAHIDTPGSWSIWSLFKNPWEVFVLSSYNIPRAVQIVDANSDGVITEQEWDQDFVVADQDGDGRVTRCEFTSFYRKNAAVNMLDVAAYSFDFLDTNGDNFLSLEDGNGSDASLVDADRDGVVTTYEYIVALRGADLEAQKAARCKPYALYRLPPRELYKTKKECEWKKKKQQSRW